MPTLMTQELPQPAAQPATPSSFRPVAICTLMAEDLRQQLSALPALENILVGGLTTENIGIEQIIRFTLENPQIRHIILCGTDGKQAIGQYPGQSFLSLAQNGLDARGQIIGAKGKRPVIRNLSQEAVEHFRQWVSVIDAIGNHDPQQILDLAGQCLATESAPAEAFTQPIARDVLNGYLPQGTMVNDPAGYFIISVNAAAQQIVLEHYDPKGNHNLTIAGKSATELYTPAIDRGLLTRLDHAAYLGRELERAEAALLMQLDYVQDVCRIG